MGNERSQVRMIPRMVYHCAPCWLTCTISLIWIDSENKIRKELVRVATG